MRDRPKDFYGPEDWTGGDPKEDVASIQRQQAQWDAEFAALPRWRRWWYMLFG